MRVEESIEINRPLQEVFNYVSDVGNYPEWMAHALEVRKDTEGPPQHSDRFIVAIKSVGRRFETPYERTSYKANRRYTDRAVGGPIPNQRWECTFQEVPGGTRLMRGSSLALAVGIRVVTKGSWGSPIGSTFIGLYGLGGILVGRIFPTDEVGAAGRVESPTSVGTIHIVVSALAFVFGIAGMFVLSRTFKRDARWRAFWPWSLVLAVAALVGFFLQSEVPWVGLSQRIFVGTITLWLVLVAFRLRSIAKAASAVQPPRVR